MKLIVKALLSGEAEFESEISPTKRSKTKDSGVFAQFKNEVRENNNFIKREVSQTFS
jgi:hypothetical protein